VFRIFKSKRRKMLIAIEGSMRRNVQALDEFPIARQKRILDLTIDMTNLIDGAQYSSFYAAKRTELSRTVSRDGHVSLLVDMRESDRWNASVFAWFYLEAFLRGAESKPDAQLSIQVVNAIHFHVTRARGQLDRLDPSR
jgi:hypothetical protein